MSAPPGHSPPEQSPPTHSPIDAVELRRAFGTFVTGVTVITTWDETGAPRGMTANSFTSVSLDPPLLLVCLHKQAASAAQGDDRCDLGRSAPRCPGHRLSRRSRRPLDSDLL